MLPTHLGPDLVIEMAAWHFGIELPLLAYVLCWFPTAWILLGLALCRR